MKFQYRAIRPLKTGKVLTLAQKKSWKPYITKGNVFNDGRVFPLGYFDSSNLTALRDYSKFLIGLEERNEVYFAQLNEDSSETLRRKWLDAEAGDSIRRRKLADPTYLTEEEMREKDAEEWVNRICRNLGIS